MTVRERIIEKIEKEKPFPGEVEGNSHFYAHLGFDSFGFVRLLLDLENAFPITFDIAEIQGCLQVDGLISLVENKLKEGGAL